MKDEIQEKLTELAYKRQLRSATGVMLRPQKVYALTVTVTILCRAPHKIVYVKSGVM